MRLRAGSTSSSGGWRPFRASGRLQPAPSWVRFWRPALLGAQLLVPPQGWRPPCSSRSAARRLAHRSPALLVCNASTQPPDDGPLAALLELRSKLKPLGLALYQGVQALWEAQRRLLQHAVARIVLGLGLLALSATAVANAWGVPAINRQLVPQVQAAASALLQREVELGAVHWVAPTGVLGLTPLGSLGPVHVGPGPVERSSARVQRLAVSVDPVQSLLQRRVVLMAKAHGAQVDLVQASNFSWFGFPEDTSPSARNFVPGAGSGNSGSSEVGGGAQNGGVGAADSRPAAAAQNGGGKTKTTTSTSTTASTARHTGSHQSCAASLVAIKAGDARQRLEAAGNPAAASSRQLQELVDQLARTLAKGATAQQSATDPEPQSKALLMGLGGATSLMHEGYASSAPGCFQPLSRSFQSGSDLLHRKQQQHCGEGQLHKLARAPVASSTSNNSSKGSLTDRFPWLQQQEDGQQSACSSAGEPGGGRSGSMRVQRQIALLNAMRLQAGRGYTLQQQRQKHNYGTRGGAVSCTNVDEDSNVMAMQHGSAEPSSSSSFIGSIANQPGAVEAAKPGKTAHHASPKLAKVSTHGAAATSGQSQDTQHEPQHRKLRQQRCGTHSQHELEQRPAAATAPALASVPAEANKLFVCDNRGPSKVPEWRGTAAALNKQLHPLQVPSGKLFSTNLGQQLQQVAARTAAAAELQPVHPHLGAAATVSEEVGGAEPAAVMTAKQRQAAVLCINSLPALTGSFQPLKQPTVAAAAPPPVVSRISTTENATVVGEKERPRLAAEGGARCVNRIGRLHAPEELKPSARVSSAVPRAYAALVVDPSTQRKKVGSASLPWSQQRPPATALIGSRLAANKQSPHQVAAEAAGVAASRGTGPDLAADLDSSDSGGSHGGVFQLVDPTLADAELSSSLGGSGGTGKIGNTRHHFLHPGYFTAASGPCYTPAPPEALIDARNRRSTLQTYVRVAVDALVKQLQRVEVSLGGIQLQAGTVDAHVHGEALPRRFEDVTVNVRLGPRYDTLSLDLTASPHQRHPSSTKCTMPSPHAHRHLRHVTGVTALHALEQQSQSPPAAGKPAPESSTVPPANVAFNRPPTGGKLRVHLEASGITSGAVPSAQQAKQATDEQGATAQPATTLPVPTLDIRVEGRGLHAPLIERLLELPMDINGGTADGELRIYSHDAASWHFPEFYGRVDVRGADFHFWDATDDIIEASLDLLFERDRLYLHNTNGSFGAVPMTLTGDLDLNPEGGQYRLTANVAGVELNQLRATLGVRPTPQPVAGGVAGVLHVTGPLEKPVFSGTAWAVRPHPAQLADCEASEAVAALLAEPGAVGAWDRVPVSGAGVVFTLDTATETLQLHSGHAELVDGGQLHGSGSMWVSPRAEIDPTAVSMRGEGQDLAAEAVARRYLPDGLVLPPGMVLGRASLTATVQGSHLEPTLEVAAQLPEASASCTAQLRRSSALLTLASPHADAAVTVHLLPPSFEEVKAAVRQAQATSLARPNVAGLDGEVGLRGLDVVPMVSRDGRGHAALRQLAVQSGQPLRLKLNGRVKVAGMVNRPMPYNLPTVDGQTAPEAGQGNSGATANPTHGAIPAPTPAPVPWVFEGDLGLESMRVNQLKLFQKLAARLSVSEVGVSVHGKGQRASEVLDLDLALPMLAHTKKQHALAPAIPAKSDAYAEQLPALSAEEIGTEGTTPASTQPTASPQATPASTVAAAAASHMQQHTALHRGGGGLQMRCGPLQVAADINAAGSQLDFKVVALKLDELELASLRGDLQEVSCSLNFDSHTGRGKVSLANPRYSGLRGDSLSGGFRWEQEVVRLEKLVLQQQKSRYEVQGEYSLPPNTPLPSSAADLALPAMAGDAAAASGRWRVQVSVPWAELQEIVPAARLLQSATSLSPTEYERAKAAFLQAIEQSSIKAAELNIQLRLMAEQLQPGGPNMVSHAHAGRQDVGQGGTQQLHLPGLQDVRGQWSGSIQAYGGGSSATSCDFDVKGQGWQWGAYSLDALLANGSYHSEEGVQLQEFVLKAGDAKLSMRGSLLGEHQDASLLLTDFPMATLRPIFRAIPALQHAAPAVPAERPQPIPSPRPLGMLTNAVGRATKGLGLPGNGLGDADSPINGLLYISGNISGSRVQPTGEVAVRLYDAAVGQTRLSQAQASARLSEAQQLTFNVEVVPAEGHRQAGYVRAGGVVPLADTATASSGAKVGEQQMDVRLSVKDGGMALLTSITPDLRWQSGLADIDVRLRGSLEQPAVSGNAIISRATLNCPLLRFPLTNVSGEVRAGGGMLTVESLDARCGRRGHIRARGSLPIYGGGAGSEHAASPPAAPLPHRLAAELSGLELRLRNLYTGHYDASLLLTSTLASPTVAGSMRFSKGIIFIVPQGAPDVPGTASGASDMLLTPTGTAAGGHSGGASASVARVFEILTRGDSDVAQQFEAVMKQEVEAVEHIVEDAGQHNVSLAGLSICLGPDLRAMYPLVMNFGVEGELAVSGPAHPDQVRVSGTVRLPSGDVNLVATQLALDRDHANLISFSTDQLGLDPLVDLVMNGGDLRVAIKGKASEWQEHLTLHYISNKARPDSGEQLDAADAARLFEDKLKAALLAEDGQLALSRLAGTTVSTLMPKIETQGAVGGTRWRLVSAPSIPGLLSLDPSLADPTNILSSITMGTEVEIQFGKKLQAAMIRKLQESDVTTQWSLNYKLNSKLRMQFNITSAPPFPKTLMFQYSDF